VSDWLVFLLVLVTLGALCVLVVKKAVDVSSYAQALKEGKITYESSQEPPPG